MSEILEQIAVAKKVIAQYVKSLNTLNVKPITFLIHPHFHFRYPSGYGAYGLSNDWRYLGYLYQTFAEMKNEGVKIHAESALMGESDYTYPSVTLHPPHDRRIIFPNEECLTEKYRMRVPEKQVFLRTRVKDGKIFRVECLLHPAEYDSVILKK